MILSLRAVRVDAVNLGQVFSRILIAPLLFFLSRILDNLHLGSLWVLSPRMNLSLATYQFGHDDPPPFSWYDHPAYFHSSSPSLVSGTMSSFFAASTPSQPYYSAHAFQPWSNGKINLPHISRAGDPSRSPLFDVTSGPVWRGVCFVEVANSGFRVRDQRDCAKPLGDLSPTSHRIEVSIQRYWTFGNIRSLFR